VRIDHELRIALAKELCAIIKGYTQANAAALLRLTQPQISALRRGQYAGFSVGRLLRLIAGQHYNIEIRLKRMDRPFAAPYKQPTLLVSRDARMSP